MLMSIEIKKTKNPLKVKVCYLKSHTHTEPPVWFPQQIRNFRIV